MAKIVVYAQELSDPWGSSILEGNRPWRKEAADYPCLEVESDEAGRETSWALRSRDGSVVSSRLTEYDDQGRPEVLTEYFSETESEVVHRFQRREVGGLIHETERVEYSGELDSLIEREIGADGKILAERELDAEGNPLDDGTDEELMDDDQGDEAEGEEAEADETESEAPDPLAVEEKDERGRVTKRISSIERHGIVYMQTASMSYEGEAEKPSMMRLDRVAIIDPDAPPRPLSSGFRQARYDASGRLCELLLADMTEGDLETDRYYRFEYSD